MRYTLLFTMLVWTQMVTAQVSLVGTVTDATTGKPIPFSTVALFHPTDSTLVDGSIANDEGLFEIKNVNPGTYRLLVRSIGYEDLVRPKLDFSKDLDLGNLPLKESVQSLDAVVVSGERSSVETRLGMKVLNIGNDLSTAGATVTEALELLPSVSTDLDGNVNIRGSSNVIIFVNGKETRRDTKSLQYLSASALQKIEVITNPSAKYDAEGVGGIINIIYKKDSEADFKMETFMGITTPYRLTGGLNTQVSSQKLTGYLNANVRRSHYENRDERVRVNESADPLRYENLISASGKGRYANITAGLTYEIDTSFSLNFEYNYDRWLDPEDQVQNNNFLFTDGRDERLSIFNKTRELEDEMSLSFSLDKEWSEERSLKLLFNGGGEVEDNESFYNLQGVDLIGTPLEQTISQSKETENQAIYQLTIDYTSPFASFGAIETGVKFDHIKYDITQNLDFVSDELFLPDNEFTITLKKYAGYLIHKKEWKQFEYGLGVRLEHFESDGLQITTGERNRQEVTRLFPNVQMVYRPSSAHQFAYNYSRRINRPGFFDLNPFVSFADPLILETGNPDLEPEFAHNHEVTYQLNQEKFGLDLTGFQRTTTNVIQEVVTAFDDERLLYTLANFGKQLNRGVEVSANYEPLKVLELIGNFSWYHTRFEADEGDVEVRFNNQGTWQANFRQRLNLKGDWSLELIEYYQAPRIGIQAEDLENTYINLALRKSFNNKRAVLTLNFQDIFDTRVFKSRLAGPDFLIDNLFKFQSRKLSLELRYKIFD